MLKDLPTYPRTVTLMPASGIQFLDFGFDLGAVRTAASTYFSDGEKDPGADGLIPFTLRAVTRDPDSGALMVEGRDSPVEPDTRGVIHVKPTRALEPFLNAWVPLPFFSYRGQDQSGRPTFEEGPTNWARGLVTELESPDAAGNTHRLVLAFDTGVIPRDRSDPYLVPAPDDSRSESQFHFVPAMRDNAWFLRFEWVKAWLDELLAQALSARAEERAGRRAEPQPCEQWARYLGFLDLLQRAVDIPLIRLKAMGTSSSDTPIPVDLILDVGNSRTCGILVEQPPGSDMVEFKDSYALELRDLERPWETHIDPFPSRIEFADAIFGFNALSRKSGRNGLFQWPSMTRVGFEAMRLSTHALGAEGMTGLSSPKRYLWDDRPHGQEWRFNGVGEDGKSEPRVSGPLNALVTEDGQVIGRSRDAMTVALRPKFSRSSLYTFMLTEIVQHALVCINSAENRGRRKYPDVPRVLRRIVLTVPTATPMVERDIMRQRAEAAVTLLWQASGQERMTRSDDPEVRAMARPEPRVVINWDEATSTQMVYLYTEITQKVLEKADVLFRIHGRQRGDEDQPSLRIAGLDIGGGTTDLMITTYHLSRDGGRALRPEQTFQEGFRIAGDDILEAVIGRHVLGDIARHMESLGVDEARALLRGTFSGDVGGESEAERSARRQFVAQIATPIALACLAAHERAAEGRREEAEQRRADDILGERLKVVEPFIAWFEGRMAKAGVPDFQLLDVPFSMDADAVGATVQLVMDQVLTDLCEVIRNLDCDVLLLSGRPSRLPAVRDIIVANTPLSPHRVLNMHRYDPGAWYPFPGRGGLIEDPKTTVAVGALVCTLADERRIQGFSIMGDRLGLKTTAAYIGEMELNGRIRNDNIIFSPPKPDGSGRARGLDMEAQVVMDEPMMIGFRQLPLERWRGTSLYYLGLSDTEDAEAIKARYPMPWTVHLQAGDADDQDNDDEEEPGTGGARERIEIVEVTDRFGNEVPRRAVAFRLQTLPLEAGYWLDTGRISFI